MLDRLIAVDGEIRPIIRFLISVLGILIVSATSGFVAFKFPPTRVLGPTLTLLFAYHVLLLPSLLLLYAGLTRGLERRPLASSGLAFYPRWKNDLGLGLLSGAGMILAVAGLEWALGGIQCSVSAQSLERTILSGLLLVVVLALAAMDEELIFRGYPFQRLVDSGGAVPAIVIASVLFGVMHWGNPSHTWISTMNTILVGILFAICYLRTRALWLPIGMHFAWNFFQGFVLGFPVSGLGLPASLLATKPRAAVWLTGGAYGPEGSILSSGIILAATVYFQFSGRIQVSPEMRELALGRRRDGAEQRLVPRHTLPADEK